MKKLTLFLAFIMLIMFSTQIAKSQVSKTVNIANAGEMATTLTADELATVTNLTVTGTIDARDFKILREAMPVLASIDLSAVTIETYNGTDGSASGSVTYPANEMPQFAFCSPSTWIGKKTLTNILLPVSVTSIGGDAFDDCSGLTSVNITASVTSIKSYAFYKCSGLTSVTISPSVTSIGTFAFYGCSGLTSITIPASVSTIGSSAFSRFKGMIIVDEGNSTYSSADGILFNKSQTLLIVCPVSKTGSYDIPTSVTSIENAAFESCSSITSISIPPSVTSIGTYAFSLCTGLTSVTIPALVTKLPNGAFYKCSGLTSVILPSSLTSIGLRVFSFCTGLTSFTIPSLVTTIGSYTFEGCSGLTSIYANAATPVVNQTSMFGVFDGVNKTSCILYVPVGAKTAYQTANLWKDFINIEEFTTGINNQLANEPVIYSRNNTLIIENAKANSIIKVYDISGRIRYSGKIPDASLSIELNKGSVYIVKLNSKSYKVIL